jgi:hypothetical protein
VRDLLGRAHQAQRRALSARREQDGNCGVAAGGYEPARRPQRRDDADLEARPLPRAAASRP